MSEMETANIGFGNIEGDEGELGQSAPEGGELDAALETEAREMGWVPKEEWNGDPERWRPADEFVQRGKEILPIVQSRMQRVIDQQKTALEKQEKDFSDRIEKLNKANAVALKKQREQIEAYFDTRKKQAVELGDIEAYEKVSKDEKDALAEFDKETKEKQKPERSPGPELSPEQRAIRDGWFAENPWFQADALLSHVAQGIHVQRGNERPHEPLEQNLAYVAQEIRKRFPEKFAGTQANGKMSGVFGGSRQSGGKVGSLAARLPQEARDAAKEFIEDGVFESLEEYAKVYFEESGTAQ